MSRYHLFLAYQIARFGVLSVPEMELICTGKCGRTSIHRILDKLREEQLIKRILKRGEIQFNFEATPELYAFLYSEHYKRNTGFGDRLMFHTRAVTNTMITLSRYSFVTGIATEFEIDSKDIAEFCFNRTPDAIVKISNGTGSFTLAVEVERTRRSFERILDMLTKYNYTFQEKMPCDGLLIVTDDKAVCKAYKAMIAKHFPRIEERTLVLTPKELTTLNPKIYGEYNSSPQNSLEKTATWDRGTPNFSSIKTRFSFFDPDPIDTGVCGQTPSENQIAKTDESVTNNEVDQNKNSFSSASSPQEESCATQTTEVD